MANLLTDEEIMNEVSIRGLSIKKKNKDIYIIDDCWNIIKEFAGICDYGINFKNLNTMATSKIINIYFENAYDGYETLDRAIHYSIVHRHGAKQYKKEMLKLVCKNKNKKEMMIEISKKTKSVKQKGVKVGDEVFIGVDRERVKVCKICKYTIHYQRYNIDKQETTIEPLKPPKYWLEKHTTKIYYKKEVLLTHIWKTDDFNCITDEDFKNEPMDYYVRTMIKRHWELV
tara:strand:- start:64 stop:750 length:687 start_codon:yes stop_codon:yes gene_type:complete